MDDIVSDEESNEKIIKKGRPKKYFTEEERLNAKRKQVLNSVKKLYHNNEKYRMKQIEYNKKYNLEKRSKILLKTQYENNIKKIEELKEYINKLTSSNDELLLVLNTS
jgi:hypothetical protein